MSTLYNWLADPALPLWWRKGADHVNGGFHDSLDAEGEPTRANRRARVIGRQIYVYSSALSAGVPGPWREAVAHGLDFMLSRFLTPDGLIRPVLSPDGDPLPGQPILYDQAFCLFGLAAAAAAGVEADALSARALRLLDTLDAQWRLPAGGFVSHEAQAYQSNPHMHLFEASLAWEALGASPRWTALADEIADLALTRFIDAEGGFLREFFDADWRPAPGEPGRLVEPGHQFEWAWLLMRWAKLRGRDDAARAARQLHRIGVDHGIDAGRGVAMDALNDDLTVRSPQARLWPQTERIKASAILAEVAGDPADRAALSAEVTDAAAGLWLYLQTPVAGSWHDKLRADGTFVDEPAPASSLYHIACAILDARARGFEI